jgi:hypothetical protein
MNDLVAIEKIAQWERLKTLVLDSVSSPITKRVYNMALNEFIAWFQQAGFAQRPLLPPLSAGSAIGKDGLIQIPITQQAWFARATERIAVRTSRAEAPREIARENDEERDCGSNNISR